MPSVAAENTLELDLLADVFNASPIGIAVESLEGQPVFVNPALCAMLGFTEEEMRGKHCVDFSPAEDAQKDWEFFQQLRSGAIDHYQIEKRYFRKDGSLVWGNLSISLLNNRPSPLVIAMVKDITDKKRAEESQWESEERLRLAVQAGRMFAYSWDVATDLIERSGESAEILGAAKDTANTGKAVSAMIHPDDREKVDAAMRKLSIEKPLLQIAYRIIRPDGKVIWLERNSRAYFDSSHNLIRMVGMVVNITERKRAEEALRESEEKFRSVFRDAGVGMVIVSPEGRFLAANRTFCDYLGYTEEELLKKTVESITVPEDWPPFAQKLRKAILKDRAFQWFQKRCLHKSGRIIYTETSASVIRGPEGDPQYFVGQVLDITERKKAEDALSGMTRKLIEAQEQERARIARELHDDVNQRLAMLAIALEQLKADPSEIGIRVQELRKQVTDMSNDVQALSHDLHSSSLDYLGVVAGIKSWCREFGERQGIQIDYKHRVKSTLPSEIGLCLFRVLQEALHNAAKHSGVKRIEVGLSERSGKIHLTIMDLGKGFDVEAVKQGKGLGLTSMRERVRLVNGTMTVDSKPMRGTTIQVRVPLALVSSPILRNMGDLKNRSRASKTIERP